MASCFNFIRYKKKKKYIINNDSDYEKIIEEKIEKIIEEKIEIAHKEALQIIVDCIEHVADNIRQMNDKIKKIEYKSNFNQNIIIKPRSKSI